MGVGVGQLDKVKKIHAYYSGFPQKGTQAYNNPLKYKFTWNTGIAFYLPFLSPDLRGKAKILRGGEVVEVDMASGPGNPELIRFPEPIGELEAIFADWPREAIKQLGLKDVEEAWEKALRLPGHCQRWTILRDLHLLDYEPVTISGKKVAPRDVLIEIGNKYLQYEKGEGNALAIRVEVIGEKNGKPTEYSYQMMDFYDPIADVTAMGRTTAFPCSIAAQMIARGEIERGVVHPSKIGRNPSTRKIFFEELAKRNITVRESVTTMIA